MVWQISVPEGRIVEIDWSDETQKWYCPTEGAEKPCSHPTTCVNFREVYLRYWKPILPYIKATLVMRFLQPLPLVDNGAYIPDGPTQRDNDRGRTRHRLQDQKIRARKRLIARKTNPHFISAWREKNSRPVPRAYFNPEVDHVNLVGHRCQLRSQETMLSELLVVSSFQQIKTMACHKSLIPSRYVFPTLQGDLARLLMQFPR